MMQPVMNRLCQITDEDGNILQDNVQLGQWLEVRERELDTTLDVIDSDTYHPHGCGVLIDENNTTVDYWALHGAESGRR